MKDNFCGELCLYAEQTIDIFKLEIERLKAENSALINARVRCDKLIAEKNAALKKAENRMKAMTEISVKDFADKLKSQIVEKFGDRTETLVSYVIHREIDNLLKETTEEPT